MDLYSEEVIDATALWLLWQHPLLHLGHMFGITLVVVLGAGFGRDQPNGSRGANPCLKWWASRWLELHAGGEAENTSFFQLLLVSYWAHAPGGWLKNGGSDERMGLGAASYHVRSSTQEEEHTPQVLASERSNGTPHGRRRTSALEKGRGGTKTFN
jgi:hypothetical protein